MDARGRFILGILFFCSILIIWFSGLTKYATFENIIHHARMLTHFVEEHYLLSVGIFGLVYILITLLAIPAASMLTLVGGFLFGFFPSLAFTIFFGTIGALLSFFMMRYLFAEFVQHHYAAHLRNFNQAVQRYGYRYLFLVR